MQVDGVHGALPAGDDDDDDSLFGSPPPSPARGRSPQLALPTGPGHAENFYFSIVLCQETQTRPRPLPRQRPTT